MGEKNYLKTRSAFLAQKTEKKEVVITPPLIEDELEVTENGVYEAPIGKGYVNVNVDVPASAVDVGSKPITRNGIFNVVGYAEVEVAVSNIYTPADEGKVVRDGQLVAQTSHEKVTSNGIIDTTYNNSVEIEVS